MKTKIYVNFRGGVPSIVCHTLERLRTCAVGESIEYLEIKVDLSKLKTCSTLRREEEKE